MKSRVGYAGLTHLGLCSAAGAAQRCEVVGFDLDSAKVAALDRGDLFVSEPDLPELLSENRERLRFTSKPEDLASCDLVFVAPDVPTDDGGTSDLSPVQTLLDCVLRHTSPATTVVVLSQVPPGFTRRRAPGQRPLYYQVETLIFGRAVERVLKPERFIVGCAEPRQPLPDAYRAFLETFACPILPMRYESAELAKISINICLAASISTANTLAEICERIGADWNEIASALRLDRRIGPHSYIQPGLGIAGGNIERDLATVCTMARQNGTDARVVEAFIASSAYRRDWALRTLLTTDLPARARIAVLGLAYKIDTASTKNSPSLALIGALAPFSIRAYDPVVRDPACLPAWASLAPSALATCEGADALVVMTPWREFSELAPERLARALAGRRVIDPYGALDADGCRRAGLEYAAIGS